VLKVLYLQIKDKLEMKNIIKDLKIQTLFKLTNNILLSQNLILLMNKPLKISVADKVSKKAKTLLSKFNNKIEMILKLHKIEVFYQDIVENLII
jgi:hypothetical protein